LSLSRRQLELRKTSAGGSDVAAICGLHPYKTRIDVFEQKVLGRQVEVNEPMHWGIELETPAANVWARMRQRWLRAVDSVSDRRWPHVHATPDRAVFLARVPDLARAKLLQLEQFRQAERGLEVKAPGWRERERWGEPGTDQIPVEHLVQVQHCMGVTGVHTWSVVAAIDRQITEYEVQFSARAFERLYERSARFMVDHVLAGVPPKPDGGEAFDGYLDRRWTNLHPLPAQQEPLILASPEMEALMREIFFAGRSVDRAKARREQAVQRLKLLIGGFGGVRHPEYGHIYWRRHEPETKLDGAAAAREAIGIAEALLQLVPNEKQRAQLADSLRTLEARHTSTLESKRPFSPQWSREFVEAVNLLERDPGALAAMEQPGMH
jgi:putative phage-type endonuclease